MTTFLMSFIFGVRGTLSGNGMVPLPKICVLNPNDTECAVDITLYFEDREPVKCESTICPARRTKHIRTDVLRLEDGSPLPRGVGYAGFVACSIPAIVQYTRVDTTQNPLALMTTMGY